MTKTIQRISEFDYTRKFETVHSYLSQGMFEAEKNDYSDCRFFKSDIGYLIGKSRQEEIPVEVAEARLAAMPSQLRAMRENFYEEVGR